MPHVDGVDDDGAGYGVSGSSHKDHGIGVSGYSEKFIGVDGYSGSGYPGVFGQSNSGPGVYGYSEGGSHGVHGDSEYGIGVYGSSKYTGGGFFTFSYGVYGSGGLAGVLGANDSGVGVSGGSHSSFGVYGSSDNYVGVGGYSYRHTGVEGSSYIGTGLYGESNSGIGVDGYSDSYTGVRGWTNSGTGIHGYSDSGSGVYGYTNTGYGVFGSSRDIQKGYAAYLDGRVFIRGPLEKPGGSFKIDHPLDPANKYLSHSFVESPDMKNVYDGVVVLDHKGEAVIELPDWFAALNKDFRYQLTAIGAPGPNLYIAQEIIFSDMSTTNNTKYGSDYDDYSDNNSSNNKNNTSRFKIAGGTSGMKVSWQVTGIRKDPWANAHRIEVEQDKPDKERGYYLHPDLYGQPEEKAISHLLFPQQGEEEKWQEEQQIINK